MTKLELLAELKTFGIEESEETSMPDLYAKLKEAKDAKETADADAAKSTTTAPAATEKPSAKAKGGDVVLTNVKHKGQIYKQGETVTLSAAERADFVKQGLIAE